MTITMPTPELVRSTTTTAPASGTAVRSHLAWAVVSALLCFAPTGVTAVLFAARVKPLLDAGDLAGAQRASRLALRFCWASLAMTWLFLLVLALGIDGVGTAPSGL